LEIDADILLEIEADILALELCEADILLEIEPDGLNEIEGDPNSSQIGSESSSNI